MKVAPTALLILAILIASQAVVEDGFPDPNTPSSDVASFYGRLVLVRTNFGPPRALLCDPELAVLADYSTCINLLNSNFSSLEKIPECLSANGSYTSASDALYLGSVGEEFGVLKVSSFRVETKCRAE